MQRYRREFLHELLSPLIKQWGREEVLRAVYELEENGGSSASEDGTRPLSTAERRKRQSSGRPNAVMIAEKADVPADKRMLLINLASRWEHKAFLPTISDVRNFLEMRGVETRSLKQRQDAFRRVINAIVDLPNEHLERLIRNSRHSGPSQLGPLSDAIKAASSAARSHDRKLGKELEIDNRFKASDHIRQEEGEHSGIHSSHPLESDNQVHSSDPKGNDAAATTPEREPESLEGDASDTQRSIPHDNSASKLDYDAKKISSQDDEARTGVAVGNNKKLSKRDKMRHPKFS